MESTVVEHDRGSVREVAIGSVGVSAERQVHQDPVCGEKLRNGQEFGGWDKKVREYGGKIRFDHGDD